MTVRVVLGSDDDDYDDLNSGDEMSNTGFVDEGEASGSGQDMEFQRMIESSPDESRPDLQIADLTEDMTFDNIMETKMTKRSQTTMEKLSSASKRNRAAYSMSSNAAARRNLTQDNDGPDSHPSDPSLAVSLEEPMPSSREIFALGETEIQTPGESFRTQTTIPFTHPEQDYGTPTVFVPTVNIQSSAGLANDIDGIYEYLQQDIANATILQTEVDTDLPSTESMGPGRKNNDTSQPNTEDSNRSSKSDSKRKRRFEDDNEPDYDGPDADVPVEFYKPRPSRSRAKRSADDLDLHMGPNEPQLRDKDDQKIKRRRTDGDAPDERPKGRGRAQSKVLEIRSSQPLDVPEEKIDVQSDLPNVLVEAEQQFSQSRSKKPKKKRGRPRKNAPKEVPKEEHTEVKPDDDAAKEDGRTQRKPRSSKVIILDDSEDELAGARPIQDSSESGMDSAKAKDRHPLEAPAQEEQEEQEQEQEQEIAKEESPPPPPPVKKAAKRGRKPKKTQSKVEDAAEDVAAEKDDKDQELTNADAEARSKEGEAPEDNNTTEDTIPSPSKRKPLQDKSNTANIKSLAADGTSEKAGQPVEEQVRTPQKSVEAANARPSPASNGKVPYRVGLSKRHRIEPLLKIIKRK